MEKLFLRPAEAAELLGFCRTTIYGLIHKEAGFPYCKIGKSVRISLSALREWAHKKGMEISEPPSKARSRRTKTPTHKTTRTRRAS